MTSIPDRAGALAAIGDTPVVPLGPAMIESAGRDLEYLAGEVDA